MKKILNILLIVISVFLTSQVYAQYYPIPTNKSEKYRAEINREIEKQYPKIIKQIDNVENEIINEKDPFDKGTILDMGINNIMLHFYDKLLTITQKYTGKKEELNNLETDYSGKLYDALIPYLNDNKINTSKIDRLEEYGYKIQIELEKKYSNLIWQLQLKILGP